MLPWQHQKNSTSLQAPDDQDACERACEDTCENVTKYAPVLTVHDTDAAAGLFTREESARLHTLRERMRALAPLDPGAELDLDLRRLEFTRWLVEQGNLSEGA
jgi:hypothetical protein